MIMGEVFNFRQDVADGRVSLATLNSLTKYPSIETYHQLGAKGVLQEFVEAGHPMGERENLPPLARFVGGVEGTEKVEGTNARIIVLPNGMVIIGSREELLWATGDLIHNPTLHIVGTLRGSKNLIQAAGHFLSAPDRIRVVYGEVYGDGVGGAGKRYAAGRKGLTGFRIFDVANVPVMHLVWSTEEAAAWRQRGGQSYESKEVVDVTARQLGVDRVPNLLFELSHALPKTLASTHEWLKHNAPRTRVPLAQAEDGIPRAEGIVLRGADVEGKRLLAKIRFEDYERTEREQRSTHQPRPSKSLIRTLPGINNE